MDAREVERFLQETHGDNAGCIMGIVVLACALVLAGLVAIVVRAALID